MRESHVNILRKLDTYPSGSLASSCPSSVVRISSSRTSSVLLHNAVWRLPLRPPLYTRSNLMVLHQQADAIPKSRNRDNCLRSPSPQYEGRSQPPEPFPVRLLRPCDGAPKASRHNSPLLEEDRGGLVPAHRIAASPATSH